jgi:hypothetical protein
MTPREQLEAKLDELSDDQLNQLLRYVDVLRSPELPDDDPAIGFLNDDSDFDARNTRQTLYDDLTSPGGWTQKKD